MKYMSSNVSVLQVVVQTPLRRSFDYLPKIDTNISKYSVGQRVLVPFGRRTIVGIVVGMSERSDFPIEKLKRVMEVLDDAPIIDERLFALYRWASDYYCHPIGEVVLGSLPKNIRLGKPLQMKSQKTPSMPNSTVKKEVSLPLTQEQQVAVSAILAAKGFKTFLLAGVTGSGKTEVYMQAIAAVLADKKQALVLVPEIALTPQTVRRFQARFEAPILLLHSGLSDGKRMQAWLSAMEASPCIVIGTRSAVFAPLKNLGLIVIDEAHDLSFKQQSRFRYSARNVAVMRAKLCDVPIVLGSATPSLESYYNALENKYHLLQLTSRPGKALLPKILLHDLKNEKLNAGLSPFLIEKIRQHLDANNQVLVYLNRRGFAPVLICHHCGWVAKCTRCDARLTVHQQSRRLICHHCSYQKRWVKICESCHQSEVMMLGVGTEQLEQALQNLFPHKTIVRIDRDNTRTVKVLEERLSQVHAHEADILIGTQLLVKGHHFEKVTLVAAIDVDNALFSSDFRAIEHLGQSLIQVAGRAGRLQAPGEVVIQTHQPDHPQLKTLFEADYFAFVKNLLRERQLMELPPYRFLTMLKAEAKTQEKALSFLREAKHILAKMDQSLELIGPLPAALSRKAGVYQVLLTVQSTKRNDLHHALANLVRYLEENTKRFSGVRWVLDVDSVEVN